MTALISQDGPAGGRALSKWHLADHRPVLLADETDWQRILQRSECDPVFSGAVAAVVASARALLSAPLQPFEHDEGGGMRFLTSARLILGNVLRLGSAWHLTGDRAFAQRLEEQIHLAVLVPHWNPSHFLDTAEISLAVSVGLAWLDGEIDAAVRTRWQDALIDKALRPSFNGPEEHRRWQQFANNWLQVCHGGLVAAALVTSNREPELAQKVIERAVAQQALVAHNYAPDGAYIEGPTYWNYGTSFAVILVELLRRNFQGESFGLLNLPGFMESGIFYRQMILPSGEYFCYGDCSAATFPCPTTLWFAAELGKACLGDGELEAAVSAMRNEARHGKRTMMDRFLPLALLWAARSETAAPATNEEPPALAWLARGRNPVAVARTAWDDPQAAAFAIKGGGTWISHAHMDAGSFVFEAGGVRWAEDLGMHNYQTLELAGVNLWDSSADGDRWKLFRLGPQGHNLLLFGQQVQVHGKFATNLQLRTEPDAWVFELDLSPVYEGQAETVRRRACLNRDGSILVCDSWDSAGTGPVIWQWITRANVRRTARGLILECDGRELTLEIQVSAPFEINVEEARTLLHPGEPHEPDLFASNLAESAASVST